MAQRCQCKHYRFAHVHAKDGCDLCGCRSYRPACDMCGGSHRVLVAAAAVPVDWAHGHPMPCPRCTHG